MQEPVLIIEPGRAEKNYWVDLWRYRELFLVLAWRDISVRYKQTIIGILWAIIRLFLTMVVFTVIFGRIAMVGMIDGFRGCILGGNSPIYLPGFLLSLAITAFFPWLGVSRFRRMEKTFADLI